MNKEATIKDIVYYMSLPYTITLRPDEEGDYIARVQELEGCSAHGGDASEALTNLQVVRQAWIQECLDSGQAIPEPQPEEEMPSGKWVQRVPRSLHKRLTDLAKREQVSLNQLVTSMLAEGLAVAPVKNLLALAGQSDSFSDLGHAWKPVETLGWQVRVPTMSQVQLQSSIRNVLKLLPAAAHESKTDAYPKKDSEKHGKTKHSRESDFAYSR